MSCDVSSSVCAYVRCTWDMSLGLLQLLGECLILHVHLCQLLSYLIVNLHELADTPVQADSLSFAQVTVMVPRRDALLLTGGGQSDEGGMG